MDVTLVLNDRIDMENLPKTMIDVLNGTLKENRDFSWRVHGMHDKVVMNIMWTNTNSSNTSSPPKTFTLATGSDVSLLCIKTVIWVVNRELSVGCVKPIWKT